MGLSLLLLAGVILFLFKVVPVLFQPSILKQIQNEGKLIVITRNSPTTYYEGPDGSTGFEYELAKKFADSLGVELEIVIPENLNDIFDMLDKGEAHFAAAGLTITDARKERALFGPSYQEITEQLVYHNQDLKPESIEDIELGNLEVVAHSSHVETLQSLKQQYPTLAWNEHANKESEELLQLVEEKVIDYTIADSNELAMNQRFLLELRSAFDISEPKKLAWAFPRTKDTSLYDKAMVFFWRVLNNGEITQLIERHYGHVAKFDYVGSRIYIRHIATRLSKYQQLYQQAADKYELDWKLLAAMGYQESHWNPKAVSPTGVRGIMMLTQPVAKSLGVTNRLDAEQNIYAGARFHAKMKKMVEHVDEPDRTWLALAAYNVGRGHFRDAQQLARKLGKDPDRWAEMKEVLPLLSDKKYYKDLRYGYARGSEPVDYVTRIRSYNELLHLHFGKEKIAAVNQSLPGF